MIRTTPACATGCTKWWICVWSSTSSSTMITFSLVYSFQLLCCFQVCFDWCNFWKFVFHKAVYPVYTDIVERRSLLTELRNVGGVNVSQLPRALLRWLLPIRDRSMCRHGPNTLPAPCTSARTKIHQLLSAGCRGGWLGMMRNQFALSNGRRTHDRAKKRRMGNQPPKDMSGRITHSEYNSYFRQQTGS